MHWQLESASSGQADARLSQFNYNTPFGGVIAADAEASTRGRAGAAALSFVAGTYKT